jgi:hypothetical protein
MGTIAEQHFSAVVLFVAAAIVIVSAGGSSQFPWPKGIGYLHILSAVLASQW